MINITLNWWQFLITIFALISTGFALREMASALEMVRK